MKKCVKCGKKNGIKDADEFCPKCGSNVFIVTRTELITGAMKKSSPKRRKKSTIKVLKMLKECFEKSWGIQGIHPQKQMEEHMALNPDGEKIWRQLYIDALDAAIAELEKPVNNRIDSDMPAKDD